MSFTRRTILRGAPLAIAALALPVLAEPAANAAPSGVAEAIAGHRAAYRAVCIATRRAGRLEGLPGLHTPRVQVSRLLGSRDDQGNNTWKPIYAYNHADIEQTIRRWYDAQLSWTRGEARIKADTKMASLLREKHLSLTREIRRYNHNARACGLTAAEAALNRAYKCEREAMLALILVRPTNTAEERAKRNYMRKATAFRDGWQDDLAARIIDALASVA